MTEMRDSWYSMMRKKYDTNDDGVRKIMAERQKKGVESRKQSGKKYVGGFNLPGVAKEAGERGRKTRYGNES